MSLGRLRTVVPVLLASFLSANGAEIHVAPPPLGDDANPGTLAQPFATVMKAELSAAAGDEVLIHAGVYRESVLFRASGTENDPIVYRPYDDGSGPHRVTISGFDLINPGSNGAGQWELHGGSIYKIQLTPDYGLTAGASTILLNGEPQKIARWPNAPAPFDFDWQNMAAPEEASVDTNSGGPQLPFFGTFHTAHYLDNELPFTTPDVWVGARLDTSPAGGAYQTTGVVTASAAGSLTFRYHFEDTQTASPGDPYFLWNTLAALDAEGEYFYDVEGVSGPAHTLYLWAPGGISPAGQSVEIKSRQYGFDLNGTSFIQVRNLDFDGGGVFCTSNTSYIDLDRLHFRFCGQGLDSLSAQRAAIWLRGSNYTVTNCLIEDSYGGGIHCFGTDAKITNNVIRNNMLYSIGTWGGDRVDVIHNTTYLNGGLNIAMFSPASKFNYNHCYLAGLRTTDESNMNSHFNGDALGTEIAWNWVHTNVARKNATYDWGGGRGIRLDTSPSNYYIHHNLIWGISSPDHSLVLFSLDANQVNYQNSGHRAYNNTIDGGIVFSGFGSIGGHDVRNNICTEIRDFGVARNSAVVRNNYATKGKFLDFWPGNTFSESTFVSAPTGNFELLPGVPAIDGGEEIAPYTDGFSGAAPDVGALENTGAGSSYWSAGALLLPEHLASLSVSTHTKPSGRSFVVIEDLPVGRMPPDEFQVRIGAATILDDYRIVFSTETHRAQVFFEITSGSLEGINSVQLSLDGTSFTDLGHTIRISPGGMTIDELVDADSTPDGGGCHLLKGSGFSPPFWMIPVNMQNLTGVDLNTKPVPIVFNSREQIALGRMNPDCSDLRLMHWETQTEIPYYLESGANGETTLIWAKLEQNLLTRRFSQLDESAYYLTFGVPSRPPVSDWTILSSYFAVLEHPEMLLWLSAAQLGESLSEGAGVTQWTDLSGLNNDASQTDNLKQPIFCTQQINGFPAVRFDGQDFMDLGELVPTAPDDITVVLLHKNDPANDSQGRLLSAGLNGQEIFHVRSGSSTEVWNLLATRRPGKELVQTVIGKRFLNNVVWFTGNLAEMIVIGEHLDDATGGPYDQIREFFSRKYNLNGEARGIPDTAAILAPLEILVGDTPATEINYLNERNVEFIAPPSPPTQSFPLTVEIEARRDLVSVRAPETLAYFLPIYDSWSSSLPVGARGPDQNPDADYLPNLLEFALDSDPTERDAPPVLTKIDGTSHVIFKRNTAATDVRLQIEHSTDLEVWTRSELADLNQQLLDDDPDGDGSSRLYQVELPPGGQVFYRFIGTLLGE